MAKENFFASSIGTLLFKNRKQSGSIQDRRSSSSSTGFQVKIRSKSLEDLVNSPTDLPALSLGEKWSEIDLLKSLGPYIVCILPSVAQDFVTSAMYAIGANPLLPEDPDDVEKLLSDCKGVLIDVSAREAMIEAVIEHHIPGLVPLVLVVTNSGTNDKRKALARKIMEKCKPTLVSGRLGDVHALGQDTIERVDGILADEDNVVDIGRSVLPYIPLSPRMGRKSPVRGASPRFNRRNDAKKVLARANTPIPHMVLKGQFRHQCMNDIPLQMALDSGRKLAAQQNCFVHLFEVNVLTCGEFFLEINNTQFGMEYLHSTVQCAAGIMVSVASCVDEQGHNIGLPHCAHGLAFYHVAAQEASLDATYHSEVAHPGTLRIAFIDKLHELDEIFIRLKALIVKHNQSPT